MSDVEIDPAQKMKFSIKDFFSKCDQIRRNLRIWSHLLKNSLMENLVFCAVWVGGLRLLRFLKYLSNHILIRVNNVLFCANLFFDLSKIDNLTIVCPVRQDSRKTCWFLLGKNHNTGSVHLKFMPCWAVAFNTFETNNWLGVSLYFIWSDRNGRREKTRFDYGKI